MTRPSLHQDVFGYTTQLPDGGFSRSELKKKSNPVIFLGRTHRRKNSLALRGTREVLVLSLRVGVFSLRKTEIVLLVAQPIHK